MRASLSARLRLGRQLCEGVPAATFCSPGTTLGLDVWIARSAPQPLREACFGWARVRGHLFPDLPAKMTRASSSISLHHEALLSTSDYGRGACSDVESVARARFDHFATVTLPPIVAATVEIEWPAA